MAAGPIAADKSKMEPKLEEHAQRRVFLVLARVDAAGQPGIEVACETAFPGSAHQLIHVMKMVLNQRDDQESGSSTSAKGSASLSVTIDELHGPTEYALFSLFGSRLPETVTVMEIPKPGVLIGIRSDNPVGEEVLRSVQDFIRIQMQEQHDGLKRFLSSIEAQFEPAPVSRWDVFLSYSIKDSGVATEIKNRLADRGLKCFLAEKDLSAGKVWRDEILSALRSSRMVLLLLTPHSIRSKWVMCEAGAFWALGKPLLPAYQFIKLDKIPELITEYQCRRFESESDRSGLFSEIEALCRDRKSIVPREDPRGDA